MRQTFRYFLALLICGVLGQSIAVAHDPPRITLHSVQDGREERSLTVTPLGNDGTSGHIAAIWWFQQEKKQTTSSIPDIFKRNNIIVRRFFYYYVVRDSHRPL